MHTIIIAEAGVNHNGDIDIAKKLIDVAVQAGVDYVKFQTFKAGKLVSKGAKKAEYQNRNLQDGNDTQFEMLKKLELDEESHLVLIDYCRKKKIGFLSTGFDNDSVDFLSEIGMDFVKIPSGEITNKPFLIHLASKGLPVILSTGMATIKEIEDAMKVLNDNGVSNNQITLLHCTTEYPTPMKDVNLNAMLSIRDRFKTQIGYSDHTEGIEIPIAAVALGAKVIEKHYTLDKNMTGPDHKASIEPHELIAMAIAIRNIESALGDRIKKPSVSEQKNISVVRKSIVAACKIQKGDMLTSRNLTTKRPGTGISPMKWDDIINGTATRDYEIDDLIEIA
jgi:N,N'-diacetyllegionaminate synthase